MKRISFIIVMLILTSLTSCALDQTTTGPASTDPAYTVEYADPAPETYVAFMPIIREYFYYRKQAVISARMDEFWGRFPEY